MPAMKDCAVPDCPLPHAAKGLCQTHYQQRRRQGQHDNHRVRLPPETHRRLMVAATQRSTSIALLATAAIEAYLVRTAKERG